MSPTGRCATLVGGGDGVSGTGGLFFYGINQRMPVLFIYDNEDARQHALEQRNYLLSFPPLSDPASFKYVLKFPIEGGKNWTTVTFSPIAPR
jgi:hypothetical protein